MTEDVTGPASARDETEPRFIRLLRALDSELAFRRIPRDQRESLYQRALVALSYEVTETVQDAVIDQLRQQMLQSDAELDARD